MNAPIRVTRSRRPAPAQAHAITLQMFDSVPDTHLIRRELHETIQALSVGTARDYEIAKLLESAYEQGAENAEEDAREVAEQERDDQKDEFKAILADINRALDTALTMPAETESEFQQFAARICDIQEVINHLRCNHDDSFDEAATALDKTIPLE